MVASGQNVAADWRRAIFYWTAGVKIESHPQWSWCTSEGPRLIPKNVTWAPKLHESQLVENCAFMSLDDKAALGGRVCQNLYTSACRASFFSKRIYVFGENTNFLIESREKYLKYEN